MVTANNERLTLTIPQFAKLAGISRNQAYALAATDSLGVPIIRLGKRMILPKKSVLAMLEGNGKPEEEAQKGK